jgi:bacillithiol system protein YtxJ
VHGAALITSRLELDRALDASVRTPVFVFKHSLACVTSAWSRKTYEEFAKAIAPEAALCTLIEVQAARDVSDELARRTGVRHQTPQVILLRGGKAVWDASHWDISEEALREALEGAAG